MLPVLMYHDLVRDPEPHHTTAQVFEEHLVALRRSGHAFWSGPELVAALRGEPPRRPGVLLTFDDGYASLLHEALPLLQAHDARASVFLITSKMGDGPVRTPQAARRGAEEPYLRWSEVERLLASGRVEVHSHTHEHRRWRHIEDPHERLRTLQDDLCRSRTVLQARLGQVSDHLAWPWGDFDQHYLEAGRSAGFRWFYAAHRRANRPGDSGLEIGRIHADGRSAARLMATLRAARWGGDDLLSAARASRGLWRRLTTGATPR